MAKSLEWKKIFFMHLPDCIGDVNRMVGQQKYFASGAHSSALFGRERKTLSNEIVLLSCAGEPICH